MGNFRFPPRASPSVTRITFLAAWWVAAGEDGVWVTHPNQDVVTRTDPASAAVTAEIPVPVGRLFGVAAGGS